MAIDLITVRRYGSGKTHTDLVPMPKDSNYPFEKSLARLEKLVEQMENGDLTLEASLKSFEEGIKLTRECQQALQQAEQKVKLLVETDGLVQDQPFQTSDD